ncbi:MAG: Hpt domain-containing protein [Oscillospiraceae bacterium]|nr:Hpt domain-containing protein [Oscillospiraceae bacterium]
MAWDSGIIDLDDAITRAMGRKEHYKSWLDSFFENDDFKAIEEAFANKDRETALDEVHKMKGTAGNLSVMRVFAAADALCEKLRANADLGTLAADLEALRDSFFGAKKMYEENTDVLLNYGEIMF